MRTIKHIWKYLTSPTYRFWIDFCAKEEFINRNMKLIKENLKMRSYPMFRSTHQSKDGGVSGFGFYESNRPSWWRRLLLFIKKILKR